MTRRIKLHQLRCAIKRIALYGADIGVLLRSVCAAVATEYVWFNYPRPVELHDYRYLGKGFRERERIKRKMKRWKLRLEKMPELERQALLWAMNGY